MIKAVVVTKDGIISHGMDIQGRYGEQVPANEQEITVLEDDKTEKYFKHSDHLYFLLYQDNGKGWERVYDSREQINRQVEYDIPEWFANPNPAYYGWYV